MNINVPTQSYEVCACGFNPTINEDKFKMQMSEYYFKEKLMIRSIEATCKQCKESFHFKLPLYERIVFEEKDE